MALSGWTSQPMRAGFAALALALCATLAASGSAQETAPAPAPAGTAAASPSPAPTGLKKTGIKLLFLPPPMEGLISLGIYNHAGKLVRVLHRQAKEEEFFAALDGYITHWDGRDDAGQALPAGSYRASGYAVGPLTVRRDRFLCNDWVRDADAPRPRAITNLKLLADDKLLLLATMADGRPMLLQCNAALDLQSVAPAPSTDAELAALFSSASANGGVNASMRGDRIFVNTGQTERDAALPGLTRPMAVTVSRAGTLWVADAGSPDRSASLVEYTMGGQRLREYPLPYTQPEAIRLAAASNADLLFCLAASGSGDTLSVLSPSQPAPGSSMPVSSNGAATKETAAPSNRPKADSHSGIAILAQKQITRSDSIEAVRSDLKLANGKAFTPQPSLKLTLVANPLEQDRAGSVEVSAGFDEHGSWLQTAKGLPLKQISTTPNLKWAALGRGSQPDTLVLFQSDGAAVEEFTLTKISEMMAFDCGDFDLDPAALQKKDP